MTSQAASFENKPIRDAVLALHHIEKLMLTQTDVKNALTVQQAYEKCGLLATGKQQVIDTIKKLYQQGRLKRIREQKGWVYYADPVMTEEQFLEYANAPRHPRKAGRPKGVTNKVQSSPEVVKADPRMPDIKITKDGIILLHPLCRITIEYPKNS